MAHRYARKCSKSIAREKVGTSIAENKKARTRERLAIRQRGRKEHASSKTHSRSDHDDCSHMYRRPIVVVGLCPESLGPTLREGRGISRVRSCRRCARRERVTDKECFGPRHLQVCLYGRKSICPRCMSRSGVRRGPNHTLQVLSARRTEKGESLRNQHGRPPLSS